MDESKTVSPADQRPRLSQMQGEAQGGLVCRQCGCRHFEVLYTRRRPGSIMRVRQCRHCGKRMVTREVPG